MMKMSSRSLGVALAASLGVASGSAAQTADSSDEPGHLRTSASATVTVPADLATVRFQYRASGETPYAAGQQAARRANAIREAIASKGVALDSLTTPSAGGWWWGRRSSMRFEYRRRDTVYVTQDKIQMQVRDLSRIGAAIDTALAEGAQTVSDVKFEATETEEAHRKALAEATGLVRAHAETMARAAGGNPGRLLELSTEKPVGYERSRFPSVTIAPTTFQEAPVRTTIVAPEIEVEVTVYGVWEFIPGRDSPW
jgi:uncharacterized protein YggE